MFGEDEGFDNYDPRILSNFDNGGTPIAQGTPAYFDIRMVSTADVALTVELFNSLRSFARILNPSYAKTNFAYTPQSSLDGAAATSNVGFMANGDLQINSTTDAHGHLTVSCSTFPYRSLLQSSEANPFRITRIRQTVVNDAQIDNNIVHFANSFVGGNQTNSINPRTYFNPSQFQGKIVDIPLNVKIDAEKGLQYIVNAGETVQWNVQIQSL